MDTFLIFFFTFIAFMIFNRGGKKKYSNKESIYNWMEEMPDYDEYLLSTFENRKVKNKTIDNLKVSKRIIMSLTKKNKETLRLYRAFYIQRLKESTDELYFKTILVILTPITLYLIRDYLPRFVGGNENTLILVIIFLFITVAAITDRLNKSKRRMGLLIELIDICIEEIEEKEKS